MEDNNTKAIKVLVILCKTFEDHMALMPQAYRPCALLNGFQGNREVSRDSCGLFGDLEDARGPGASPLHSS
jgi:hypothetical protein